MRKKKSLKMDVYGFKVTITSNNINIKNSYKVTSREMMEVILNIIKEYVKDYGEGIEVPFDHRSIKSMVREWVAHNNLHKLGYKKEQTKNIDLNYPQKWHVPVVYWFLSLIKLRVKIIFYDTFPNGTKIDLSNHIEEFNEHQKGIAYGGLGYSYSKTIYPDGTIIEREWKIK